MWILLSHRQTIILSPSGKKWIVTCQSMTSLTKGILQKYLQYLHELVQEFMKQRSVSQFTPGRCLFEGESPATFQLQLIPQHLKHHVQFSTPSRFILLLLFVDFEIVFFR